MIPIKSGKQKFRNFNYSQRTVILLFQKLIAQNNPSVRKSALKVGYFNNIFCDQNEVIFHFFLEILSTSFSMLNFSSDKKNIKLSFSVYYTIVFSRGPALVVFASKSIMPIFNNTFLLKKNFDF